MANELDKNINETSGTNSASSDEAKAARPEGEAKPKKKSAIVFNAQYSKTNNNRRPDNNRRNDGSSRSGSNGQQKNFSGSRRNDGTASRNDRSDRSGNYSDRSNYGNDRRNDRNSSQNRNNSQNQQARGIIKPRPKNERTFAPISERTASAVQAAVKEEETVQAVKAQEAAAAAPVQETAPAAETAAVKAQEAPMQAETKAPAEAAPEVKKEAAPKAAEKEAPAKEEAPKTAEKEAPVKEAAPKAEEKEAPVKEAAPKAEEKEAPARKEPVTLKTIASVVEESLPTIKIVDHIVMPDPAEKKPKTQNNERRGNGDRRNSDRDGRNGERRNSGDRDNRNSDRDNRNSDRDSRNGERRNNGDRDNRNSDRDNRNGERRNNGDRDNNRTSNYRGGEGRNGSRSQDGRSQDNRGEGRNGNNRGGEGRNGGFRSGDRDNNNRGNFRSQDNRNGGFGGNRNNDRAAAAPVEDVRGKESRNNRRTAGNRNTDHDNLGKKQENYINLEKHGGKKKPIQQPMQQKDDPNEIKSLVLPEKMTIKELADAMKLQPSALIKNLFMKGNMVTMNSEITYEDAEELAMEFNYVCEPEEKVDVIAELLKEEDESEEGMITRPPVVCVMGHVDHGKTSLLDAIRSTRVTDREAGGITQAIGASVVTINGQKITFLDTPGHEAFTAMRMRGANSTDIAVLVVAADDGVMPQTIEAINHAKAAGVEIIVAVNKIDKPGANVERVKQELTEYGLVAEDWGGSTVFCPVSAKTHEGIDEMLEMILLTADVLELKANPNRNARGLVIEAELDKGRGSVATVLVQKGTLRVGDNIACGSSYGKVRAMIDDKGRRVKEAGPSTPVEILGLNSVPAAGETFVVCDNDKDAKEFAETYIAEEKNRLLEETKQRMTLESLFSQIQAGNVKELNLIVKADVQGSVEAVKQSLMKLSNEEVVVKVIHGGVGAINESDVILASASNAIIIGFNVRPDTVAKATADREKVEIRLYNVIYTAIEEIERKMKGMKDPVYEEKVIGHAEIRMIFKASGVGNIAGSYVMDGVIERGCKVRISREGKQIYEGNLASLKRFKDDVKEVKTNFECGLVFEDFNDIQELDMVEAYKMVEVPQ